MSWLRRGHGVAVRPEPSAKKLRNSRFMGCTTKRGYTIEQAEARIASATLPLTFYKCSFCDAHHMTRQVTPAQREVSK